MAALAIAVVAIVVGACASPGPTGSAAAPVPCDTPDAGPDRHAARDRLPEPRPGAGLGCGEPIGARTRSSSWAAAPGPIRRSSWTGSSPTATRRRIADLGVLGQPSAASVSPCGHLAVQSDDDLVVIDLRDPERSVRVPDAVTGEWAFGRDGRITLITTAGAT